MTTRMGRLRIGTRLLLLLLIPMTALLVMTGVANLQGLKQAQALHEYQQVTQTSFQVADIADALARERAATVRARLTASQHARAVRDARRREVDRRITTVARRSRSSRAGDVGGALDAVRRQLFALRLRNDTLSAPALQSGYGQAMAGLEALRRALAWRPPTRDIATAAIADLALRSAVEAARSEQLDVWTLLERPDRGISPVTLDGPWAALERAGLDAFRSWAPSWAVADLNAALLSPPGLYVRRRREQLSAEGLATGPEQAREWWQQSGARLAELGDIRRSSREALTGAITDDLAAEHRRVVEQLALSLLAVTAGLGLGLLLRRSITRSLRELSRRARALSRGDLELEIAEASDDEISAVGAAINRVGETNQRLVAEVQAMNRAIATKQLTRRADATTFQGAWGELLDGMNGTMTEVARLHAAERRELGRQEDFGLVGRQVVSGELTSHDAYGRCCRLLVDHIGAVRAEVYEQTVDGWQRTAIAGADAPAFGPAHDFNAPIARADACSTTSRPIGAADGAPVAVLSVDLARHGPLVAADLLFVDGVARLLDEAAHHRRAEMERVRAQRLEATGTLAATFAHDFNNVLGAILNNARLGELETDDEEAAATFKAIGGAVGRASQVVDRLLRFSRGDVPSTAAFHLPELVEEACALVRPGLASSIVLEFRVDGVLPAVAGDAARIHQVVVNLITNAAQALDRGPGTISVTVDEIQRPSEADPAAGRVASGRYARVRVHDTGPGIPESIAERIFEPFFTTKAAGKGTGLGLASARTIAREHHGTLEVDSHPGSGTTFSLCLPTQAPQRPDDRDSTTSLTI